MPDVGEGTGAVPATVEGRDLVRANLEKVLCPATGFTRRQVMTLGQALPSPG